MEEKRQQKLWGWKTKWVQASLNCTNITSVPRKDIHTAYCVPCISFRWHRQSLFDRENYTHTRTHTHLRETEILIQKEKKESCLGWKTIKRECIKHREWDKNEGKAVQRRTQPQSDRLSSTELVSHGSLCLMDMFSPCQGRLQRKVLPVRAACLTTGGRCEMYWKTRLRRHGPCESLWSKVNWSLWGQGPTGPEQDVLLGTVSQKSFFFLQRLQRIWKQVAPRVERK